MIIYDINWIGIAILLGEWLIVIVFFRCTDANLAPGEWFSLKVTTVVRHKSKRPKTKPRTQFKHLVHRPT